MSNQLLGMKSCGFNIPSITKIHVFLFDEISEYIYDDENLNKVVRYSAISLPVSYAPNQENSQYSGNNPTDNFKYFTHQLTLNFAKLEELKRQEIANLQAKKLTIIFEDKNGKAWIMGQNLPCKLDSITLATGAKNGNNDYIIVFNSVEKEQLKEIKEFLYEIN